jgi:hypothetical protein
MPHFPFASSAATGLVSIVMYGGGTNCTGGMVCYPLALTVVAQIAAERSIPWLPVAGVSWPLVPSSACNRPDWSHSPDFEALTSRLRATECSS